MNQENSGHTELEQQLDQILDEYEERRHLVFPKTVPSGIDSYLNMEREYIEKLSREECNEIAIQLSQYSLYMHRLANREKARLSFCTNIINQSCAKVWSNYNEYLKADLKIYLIAQENPLVEKALKIRNHSQIRLDDLDGLARMIENLSSTISRSAYGKNHE